MKTTKIHPRYIPIFSEMSGADLMYILKRLGISQRRYGLMMNPPMNSASVVCNYRSNKKLPMRMIWPLLQQYDHELIIGLLKERANRR